MGNEWLFKWLKNVDNFDVNLISENRSIVYILKVDLEYSDQLHVLRNDYQLAPEKLVIPYNMLPDYCKKMQTNMTQKLVVLKN